MNKFGISKKVTIKKQPNENSTSKVKNLLSGLHSREKQQRASQWI